MYKFEPINNDVILIPEDAPTKTASGLYIPESAQETPSIGTVVAFAKSIDDLKIGDRVIYRKYEQFEIKLEGKKFISIPKKAVVTKVIKIVSDEDLHSKLPSK